MSEFTSEQVETMYNQAMAPEGDQVQQTTETAPAPDAPASVQEYEIKWGGETRKLPVDKVLNYAQQGYDYSKKMHDYNVEMKTYQAEKQRWEEQQKGLKERYDYLDQVDKYAEQNPDWYKNVLQAYQQQTGQVQPGQEAQGTTELDNPLLPVVNTLKAEIESIKQGLTEQNQRELDKQTAVKEAELDTQINEYKEKHGNFDWSSPDELGLTLEQKVLNHAVDNGIKSFKAAANDLLLDQIVSKARDTGKEQTAKTIQKQNLLGLKGVTDTPTVGIKDAQGVEDKSYGDLAAEALAELG